MPLYTHKDKISGKKVEILRNFAEYLEHPTLEEAVAQGLTEDEAAVADWIKEIGSGIRVVHAPGFGSKGYW